jgi:hypothetical protein
MLLMTDFDRWPTIHYTQLPEPLANSAVYQEEKTFRRELPRLLAEGHENKWAVITGDEVIGLYDSIDEADRVGLLERYIAAPVREWQPKFRMRLDQGLTTYLASS